MPLASFFEVWKSSSIGFSCLEDFNDPFECTNFGFKEDEESLVSMTTKSNAYKSDFSRKYATLALTRQPLNPIMWSHYADNHTGVVIGIDVESAGFNLSKEFIIPSQYGEVVYTNTKLKGVALSGTEELLSIGDISSFDSSTYELLKRAFLYKSLQWAHEEEIRVVSTIPQSFGSYHSGEGRCGKWNKIQLGGRPLFCYEVPRESIFEVYFGCNLYRNVSRKKLVSTSELSQIKSELSRNSVKVMQTRVDPSSWGLTSYISK